MGLNITNQTNKERIADIEAELIMGCKIITCTPCQDWRVLFDRPFTYIDASEMTYGELCGTDYNQRTYYQPIWHKDLIETKTLIIDNLAEIPPQSTTDKTVRDEGFGKERPGQIDYLFMCRYPDESKDYRALNNGSPYSVDKDVTVYIIHRTDAAYKIVENIVRQAAITNISEINDDYITV